MCIYDIIFATQDQSQESLCCQRLDNRRRRRDRNPRSDSNMSTEEVNLEDIVDSMNEMRRHAFTDDDNKCLEVYKNAIKEKYDVICLREPYLCVTAVILA